MFRRSKVLFSTIKDTQLPLLFNASNTLVVPVDRVTDGRQNFAPEDDQREQATKEIQRRFIWDGNPKALVNLTFIGEQGWIINKSERIILPQFVNKTLKFSPERFPNLKVVTLGACQSASYAKIISFLYYPGMYVVGFVPPLITAVPIKVALLKGDQIVTNSLGKYEDRSLEESDVVIYLNGELVVRKTQSDFVKGLLATALFNPKGTY